MTVSRPTRLRRRLDQLEADERWTQSSAPAGVDARRLATPDVLYPVVRCVTSLSCSAEVLMTFLVDEITRTLPSWSRDIDACEEIQRLSPDERVVLVRTTSPIPLVAAREDLFYVHRGQDPDGALYEVSEVTDEVRVPVARGAVRSRMYFASKHIHPRTDGGCRYDVIWQYDPMGSMSRVMPRSIGVHAVHAHMKDECRRLRERFGAPAVG